MFLNWLKFSNVIVEGKLCFLITRPREKESAKNIYAYFHRSQSVMDVVYSLVKTQRFITELLASLSSLKMCTEGR